MRVLGSLAILRLVALCGVVLQNVLLVRFFSLNEIGAYYLIATVAYMGNAAVFVGADLNLQRILAQYIQNSLVSGPAVLRYLLITGVIGSALVAIGTGIYFKYSGVNVILHSGIAILLSVSMYFSGVTRNLLQLSNRPARAAIANVAESFGKALAMSLIVWSGSRTGASAAFASALGSFAAAVIGGFLLRTSLTKASSHHYFEGVRNLFRSVAPIGASGLLNWGQLQGYRPIMALTAGPEVVGAISFLTNLGSTGANAIYSILAQVQIPRLYASKGETCGRYLRGALWCALLLSILVLPAGMVFLFLTKRLALVSLAYLLVVGVLIESGNALFGIATNMLNAKGLPLRILPISTCIGLFVTCLILLFRPSSISPYANVACALLVGQMACLASVYGYLAIGRKISATWTEKETGAT